MEFFRFKLQENRYGNSEVTSTLVTPELTSSNQLVQTRALKLPMLAFVFAASGIAAAAAVDSRTYFHCGAGIGWNMLGLSKIASTLSNYHLGNYLPLYSH